MRLGAATVTDVTHRPAARRASRWWRAEHPEWTITPMRRRDLPAVLAIERAAHPKPWTDGVFRNELARVGRPGDRHYVVLRHGGVVVGYGGLMFALDEAHVTNVAVAGHVRRRGAGTRLVAHLCRAAIDRGATALTLEVRAGNEAAQRLYTHFGFEPAGVRRRYYENTEDAVVMWCHGIQSPDIAARLRDLCPEEAR